MFGLSYLLGINLMPRMRNIKGLVLFKADQRRKSAHIESLCRQPIDWNLIQRRYPDMLRVAVSIKAGTMTPSTILRRLGSASAKNKLYFAFRELGRVVRTLFLLKYLNESELRRTIHAPTNKSDQFNDFAQWLMTGLARIDRLIGRRGVESHDRLGKHYCSSASSQKKLGEPSRPISTGTSNTRTYQHIYARRISIVRTPCYLAVLASRMQRQFRNARAVRRQNRVFGNVLVPVGAALFFVRRQSA